MRPKKMLSLLCTHSQQRWKQKLKKQKNLENWCKKQKKKKLNDETKAEAKVEVAKDDDEEKLSVDNLKSSPHLLLALIKKNIYTFEIFY